MKLTIIIPAYNEARTIRRLVERIFSVAFPVDFEVVIVDDYSRDRTYRIAKILHKRDLSDRIRLFRNDRNRGKGYCIQRGVLEACGEIIIVQDADFEYDPSQIPELINVMIREGLVAVFGSRFLATRWPEGMAFANWIANRFLTWLTNILYGSKITDMETCYKAIRADVIRTLSLSARRFDFEPEVTAKLLKSGVRIRETPILYHGRSVKEGKKIKARDFFIAIWVLLKLRIT